jgi:predicted ArsR family transcriptional regulator
MRGFDPEPPAATLSEEQAVWTESEDTRKRIQSVSTGLQEPATVTTIADRAACSEDAARKHLKEFAALGVVHRADDPSGTRYVRNEAHIRWQRPTN